MLQNVSPFRYVRIMGSPANTEHDRPLAFAVAQFVFAEPGPGGQTMLNTRLGCAAKVRKVFALATVGAVKVRSTLFTVMPSAADRHPGEPRTPDAQPVKTRFVPAATSEFPPPTAAGSGLKIKMLGSDIVTVPRDPVNKVLKVLAEAAGKKSKPPARTAAGAKAHRKFRKVMRNLPAFSDVLETRFIRDFTTGS
jgi:hypothetical protein